MDSQKPVHTIVLDAGPILRNDPTISTLLISCEELVTVPSVLAEIKDHNSRSRVETSWLPFLNLKTPAPMSIKTITDFATSTGDIAVLSKPDIQILALAYEIECQRNGGNWRLRSLPGQKGLNGSPPRKQDCSLPETQLVSSSPTGQEQSLPITPMPLTSGENIGAKPAPYVAAGSKRLPTPQPTDNDIASTTKIGRLTLGPHGSHDCGNLTVSTEYEGLENSAIKAGDSKSSDSIETALSTLQSESSDSEGWITPSNVKRHQAIDRNSSTVPIDGKVKMQVATITSDFAIQNVLLQMNLNLLSSAMQRIRTIKTYVLRCHACFATFKSKDTMTAMEFCSRCGKPTLTRVSCSTSQNGNFSLHLKKNMQWNHRGDRYSIPKPISGAANGKPRAGKGGGKGGWGQELILAEDQKEYIRAVTVHSRRKDLDSMDEDYLPGILSGDRGKSGGRPKIGAGRNVNSRKR